ncbi:MAG: hypothetical protein ACI4LJ_00195, partial [Anaerovoracaceae bacterium]
LLFQTHVLFFMPHYRAKNVPIISQSLQMADFQQFPGAVLISCFFWGLNNSKYLEFKLISFAETICFSTKNGF